MSHDQSFRRKVIYIGAIVLLLFPLFWIGQPKTASGPGGVLARLRDENNLSQARLGEIDPASETMKLATLGLRGVAANVLWEKSHEYKKKEDWDNYSATLNQITKLQPNFITVWEHQAHNVAYNISAEFDDYHHRYHWVKKGISFLVEGIKYNAENPRLLHYTGWITGQKMGRADEHVQFRELYRNDEDFHEELAGEIPINDAAGYNGQPDTWLTGRLWYLRAQRSDVPLKGKSPLIFYADAPMSLINYASTIEEEGILDQEARMAWRDADKAWLEYGQRPIPTSWGHNVRLGEYETLNEEIDRLRLALEELAPGVKDRIYQERVGQLTDAQRAALELSDEQLTEENYQDHWDALERVKVFHQEVAEDAPQENREKALALVSRLLDAELMSERTAQYRGIINYEYWAIRCAAEQTQIAINARKSIYDAEQAKEEAALEAARDAYENAWKAWREIFDKYPRLMDDISADDLMVSIRRYERLLQQLDEEIPADFPLLDFVGLRREKDEQVEELYQRLSKATDSAGESEPSGEPAAEPAPAVDEVPEAQKSPDPAIDSGDDS